MVLGAFAETGVDHLQVVTERPLRGWAWTTSTWRTEAIYPTGSPRAAEGQSGSDPGGRAPSLSTFTEGGVRQSRRASANLSATYGPPGTRGASERPGTSKGSRAARRRLARRSTEAADPAASAVARTRRRPRLLVHHVDRADRCDVGTLLGVHGFGVVCLRG
jgi:hypothetical protein